MDTRDFAVAILVETPDGIVVVEDTSKPQPIYQKCPGGHGEDGETPVVAAARELEEETGVQAPEEALEEVHVEERRSRRGDTHLFYMFRWRTPVLPGLKKTGTEGEVVSVVPLDSIFSPQFLPAHAKILQPLYQRSGG